MHVSSLPLMIPMMQISHKVLEELTHIFHIGSRAILSALVLEVGVNNTCLLYTINVTRAAHKSHTVLEELTHIFHIGSMAIL